MLASGDPAKPTNPLRYVGKSGYYSDDETGLQRLGVRYYDPLIGRFITPDPAQDGINWYRYSDNNPVTGIDPSGLGAWDTVKKGASFLLSLPERAAVATVRKVGQVLSTGTKFDNKKGIMADINAAKRANEELKTISPEVSAEVTRVQNAPSKAGNAYYNQVTYAAGVALLATIHWGAQDKHIPGTNNYKLSQSRSVITISKKELDNLVKSMVGKGSPRGPIKRGDPNFKELVDFGKVIGKVDGKDTTYGMIHYGNKGVHVVPHIPHSMR